jgi:hypothetical protein
VRRVRHGPLPARALEDPVQGLRHVPLPAREGLVRGVRHGRLKHHRTCAAVSQVALASTTHALVQQSEVHTALLLVALRMVSMQGAGGGAGGGVTRQQPRNQHAPRRTKFGDRTFLACVGVVLGVVLARASCRRRVFFWGKRQGDSEAQGNYRRAQERANAPLFQSAEQLAN